MSSRSVCILIPLCLIASHTASNVIAAESFYKVTISPSTEESKLQIGVTHTLWIPQNLANVRGIIVHQHGCGVGACTGGKTAAYDLHWQELAAKWDCALLGPSYHQSEEQNCRLWCDPRNGSGDAFVKALDLLAQQSKRPELVKVPWCLWGHSGGGDWASLMQMAHPEQIVAIWFQSGTAHSRWVSGEIEEPEIPAAAMKIPMMATSGLMERDHERFKTAWFGSLEMFKDYRSRGAPIAFAPDPKSGHETRDSRYLAIPFFDACLEQRLSTEPGVHIPLRDIDHQHAWLAPVPTDLSTPPVAPVPTRDYQGDRATAVWLPNERVAKAWSEFVATGAVSDSTPPAAPSHIQTKQLAKGVAVSWQAAADFESGIGAFEIRRDGKLIGRTPSKPKNRFGRPLFQEMSYHDTPVSPLPKMRFVDERGTATSDYTVTSINSAGLASTQAEVDVCRDLVFAKVDGQQLTLDLHLPKGKSSPPLIIWIHGGGWRAGSKDYPPILDLMKQGYAIASISYRFTDKAIFPAQIHDCKAAIRWLRANATTYGYNADWIAVAGGSAGGHLALLLGVSGGVEQLEGTVGEHLQTDSSVQAVIDYYGPADFVLRGKTQPERAYTEKSGSFALLGGSGDGNLDPEMEVFASPASYVSNDDPPVLAFHGRGDEVVLLDQSERIVELYKASGLNAKLVVIDEAGHGGKPFFEAEQLSTVVAFLQRTRKSIDVWYGSQQRFGQNGEPQRWINILGNVSCPSELASVVAAVNDRTAIPLSIGGDKHRLAEAGDFNAEFDWDDFEMGQNRLTIKARWRDGTTKESTVLVDATRNMTWPLPYNVDFSKVKHLQDAVQIVDGKWRLTPEGVRTENPFYDRVLSLGDQSWKDYEATIKFTLHGFTPPTPGPPTYDVTHVGVALRWRGHTADERQPSRRWYPLGCQGEFLVKSDLSQCQWRILSSQKERTYAESKQQIELGRPFLVKASVETLASGDTRYRFKLWADGTAEPTEWAVEHIEKGEEDFESGSLCLVPHNTDVTYHEMHVAPLGPLNE